MPRNGIFVIKFKSFRGKWAVPQKELCGFAELVTITPCCESGPRLLRKSDRIGTPLLRTPSASLLRILSVLPPQPSRLRPSAKSSLCEPKRVMEEVDLNVLADGFGTEHYNRTFKAELTLKAVIGTVIEDFFPRLTSSQRELFGSGSFGQFLNMPIPNGDPLIIHAMMLQEERDKGGLHLEYGDSEFCLITGLKFGLFVNLLAGTKNPKNSLLRSRLFPKQTEKSLRLRDIQNFILDPRFLDASDDDAVMLMQIFVLLRGMLGRELKSCIPPLVFELADHPYTAEYRLYTAEYRLYTAEYRLYTAEYRLFTAKLTLCTAE
ncbi:hypothetical protein LXL04_000417 [Taraxacum kok-saghyz]